MSDLNHIPERGAALAGLQSAAVRAGDWIFASGRCASGYDPANLVLSDVGANRWVKDHREEESRALLTELQAAVAQAGGDIQSDCVRIYQWWSSPRPTMEEFAAGETWPEITITPYLRTRNEFIEDPRPASTGMGVRRLTVPDCTVQVNLIAIAADGAAPAPVGFEVPDGVPRPLAGYSPAIRRGDWVFLAGDTATDFAGDFGRTERYGPDSAVALEARHNPFVWYDVPIERETQYVLEKQQTIAESAGSSLARAVKATVYLSHPSDFAGMDRVWREWFPDNPPARVVIPYMGLGLKGTHIEIAFKLLADDSELSIDTVEAVGVPPGLGHEPQAVKAGDLVFLSTVYPTDEKGNLAKEAVAPVGLPYHFSGAHLGTRYMLSNVEKILEAAGTSMAGICSRQMFFADLADWRDTVLEWSNWLEHAPASNDVEVGGPLIVDGAHALFDIIAHAG